MNVVKLTQRVALTLLMSFYGFGRPSLAAAQASASSNQLPSSGASPAKSMVVYVSDFELDVRPGKAPRRAPPVNSSRRNSASRSSPGAPASDTSNVSPTTSKGTSSRRPGRPQSSERTTDSEPEETPEQRATALVDAMSESLLAALEKAGYQPQRLRAGAALPSVGLRIRGVFAEADERNRARRLLVGGDPIGPNMLLFVGVNDLVHPEQPLYQLANLPANDPSTNDGKHGPIITVTSYAPAARFEMSSSPSDEEFEKIASEITADLTALLNSNPWVLAR